MKELIAIFFFTASPTLFFGQANILNAKSPSEIGVTTPEQDKFDNNKPLEYGFVADKDILFSKTILEIIDVDERVNFPLFFPADTSLVGKERRPLVHYLLNGILSGQIPDYYLEDNLKDKMTREQLDRSLKYKKIRKGEGEGIGEERISIEAGNKYNFLLNYGVTIPSEYQNVDQTQMSDKELGEFDQAMTELIFENNLLREEEYSEEIFDYSDIVEIRVKGIWYFDGKLGELKYRPIAIGPVIQTPRSKADQKDNPAAEEAFAALFWVFYPDVREVLYKADAFNEKNTSRPISFDDLINAHRFSGYIYKEDNVYQDREIEKYIPKNALLRLLESDRIRDKIRNLEHDMWSW